MTQPAGPTVPVIDGDVRGPVAPTASAVIRLRPVALSAVSIDGGLWAARREVNGDVAVPFGQQRLDAAGNLDNLRIAAGTITGEVRGPQFADSDVYKWLEAAAWEYARRPTDELLRAQRDITALIAAAQQPDGYLNSVVQVRDGGQRYLDMVMGHEHYCAGHLFQAAVAQVRCTGDRGLLEVAERLATHLHETFGPHGRPELDGHPVVEMGLVELYRETGNRDYLELASYFVDARGHRQMSGHHFSATFYSDRVPIREQPSVEGHAVRAVYLAAGAADVAVETGDTELLEILDRQYAAMEATKTYLTGGLGSRWQGESFGDPYELPPDRAYAETCAAVGGMQWAWRMLLATGNAAYSDIIERKLFNGFLAGVSLSGDEFFYNNPLQMRSGAHPHDEFSAANGRRPWFTTACCPPNVMRTLASLPAYTATTHDRGVQLHQYATGTVTAPVPGGTAVLDIDTEYPWDGHIRIQVTRTPATDWELSVRIPAWADGARLTVDGDDIPVGAGSLAPVTRVWTAGTMIELMLPMDVRVTHADDRIDAVRGCVAIERGPLVYALESHDQPPGLFVDDLSLIPDASRIGTEFRPDLLGGVVVVTVPARAAEHRAQPWPYHPAENAVLTPGTEFTATFVPYHLWAHRGVGAMRVWVPRATSQDSDQVRSSTR